MEYKQVSSKTAYPKGGQTSKHSGKKREMSSKTSSGKLYNEDDEFMGEKGKTTFNK